MSGQIDSNREDILQDGILPGDLMVSILANLPVKSLLKFKSVCKQWYSLISSPDFIKMHLHRRAVIANNLFLLLDDMVDEQDCKFGLFTHNFHENYLADSDVMILESPPSLSLKEKSFSIIDSCNGLVCVDIHEFCRPRLLILWNPSTRKCRFLELSDVDAHLSTNSIGLCYVEATNDYKIVGWTNNFVPFDRPYMFFYSLCSDSWEKLKFDTVNFPEVYGHPVFLNGYMHWLANTCTSSFDDMIMAFDVTTNVMSSFGVPDNCGYCSETSRKTLVIRGCLCIVIFSETEVVESGMEVWTMVEYGVEGSWIKQFTIGGLTMVMVPLISWHKNEIVFMNENKVSNILTFYDPFTKNQNYLEFKSLYVYQVFNYVESLASVEPPVAPSLQLWG